MLVNQQKVNSCDDVRGTSRRGPSPLRSVSRTCRPISPSAPLLPPPAPAIQGSGRVTYTPSQGGLFTLCCSYIILHNLRQCRVMSSCHGSRRNGGASAVELSVTVRLCFDLLPEPAVRYPPLHLCLLLLLVIHILKQCWLKHKKMLKSDFSFVLRKSEAGPPGPPK